MKTKDGTILIQMLVLLVLCSCQPAVEETISADDVPLLTQPYCVVLGVAQDAGYPQASCEKACCSLVWEAKAVARQVSCLGVVDPQSQQLWVLDATPDFRKQWQSLKSHLPVSKSQPDGILLTHAHIGHYTGLMQLGREVMGAQQVPVYVMPRMDTFLRQNGPWSQLVDLGNIKPVRVADDTSFVLNERLSVHVLEVPHRDEYSETVGYRVQGPKSSFLFIPDIDKWERWERSLAAELAKVDYAFLDATFFADGELPNRDMSKIPHPFVVETMDALQDLPAEERAKVHFIHLNHTNPLLQEGSEAQNEVTERGFHLAWEGQKLAL